MIRIFSCSALTVLGVLSLLSCATESERKPVGPKSDTSQLPWNMPQAGQGQGQFGMLPQNQYRR